MHANKNKVCGVDRRISLESGTLKGSSGKYSCKVVSCHVEPWTLISLFLHNLHKHDHN